MVKRDRETLVIAVEQYRGLDIPAYLARIEEMAAALQQLAARLN